MIQKIKHIYILIKNILISKDKSMISKAVVILSICLGMSMIIYTLRYPMRGVCRVILQSGDDSEGMSEDRIVGIEAQKVKLGTTLREVKSIGVLKANAEVMIKSEIPGKIKEVLFEEGSQVSEGQDLIKFEDDLFVAGRDKASAKYHLAKAEFERSKTLYDKKVGAQKSYEESLANMNAAKAELNEAEYQLSKTNIKAPFSGIIGIMKVSKGNIVQQQTELVKIVDNSSVKVEFMIPAKFIEDVAQGQSVDLTVDSFKDQVFTGSVDAIDSEVDTKNHSILVRAVVPNENGLLKHGLFANITLVTGEKSDVMLIDEDSLDREGSIEFVWVIDDKGRAYRRRVMTGARNTNGVEILAGLKEGEYVVTAGQLKLSDGVKVKILNNKDDEIKEEKIDTKSDNNDPSDNKSDKGENHDDSSKKL